MGLEQGFDDRRQRPFMRLVFIPRDNVSDRRVVCVRFARVLLHALSPHPADMRSRYWPLKKEPFRSIWACKEEMSF